MLAVFHVQPFDANARGDTWRAQHERLNQFALRSGTVEQRDHRQPALLEIGLELGHPSHHTHTREVAREATNRFAQGVPHHVDGMWIEDVPIHERQDLPEEVFGRLDIRRVPEISNEEDALPLMEKLASDRSRSSERQTV